jgi:hypothetical protein
MRHICAIILAAASALQYAPAADTPAAPDFSSYPQTAAFLYFTRGHANASWHLHQRTNLLAISAFHRGDDCALQYFVTESGQESDYRDVYDWAKQASQRKQLSETNLTGLRAALRDLPPQNLSPPIERLVIVSFRDGTNWVTRSYDSIALPKAMRQIYEIVGERFESKSTPPPDPIAALVAGLGSSWQWNNGLFPVLGLPATASTEEVVARVFRMKEERIPKILEIRKVQIKDSLPADAIYTAVLIETDSGRKIVLLRYLPPAGGWWTRVYGA